MAALMWFEYFANTGVRDALIQKRGDIQQYLDTAWTLQLTRSVLIAAAIFLAAPLVGRFFAARDAVPLVRVIALVALLRGFTSPRIVMFRRELDFKRDIIWRGAGSVVASVVAIVGVFVHRSAWPLVLSIVVAQIVECTLSHVMLPHRPRWRLDREHARELLRFGRWVFLLNLLGFAAQYADTLVVGRLLGVTALGVYQMAQQLSLSPMTQLGNHLHGVMFPAFSKMGDGPALRAGLLRTLRLVLLVALPMGCFVTGFAEPLVRAVLGEQWLGAVPPLRLLTWAGVFSLIGRAAAALLEGAGRPDRSVRGTALGAVLLAVLLYPATLRGGASGAAAAVVLCSAITMCYRLIEARRLTGGELSELWGASRMGIAAAAPFLAVAPLVWQRPSWAPLAAVAAGLAYAVLLWKTVPVELNLRGAATTA
jgi:O-antigen/teichoic acid export membrane protein